ncbi:MAG TPA: restriction endonuclease subunit S [Solirubrobacterales bacterium]|nr:restriction endonuclease subunit S [Solirubrobacterales bacterium]
MKSEAAWETRRLGEVADDCRYGYTASATDRPEGPRFLRITDIVGDLDWESVPFVEASERDAERYLLKDGDIVIARTGANVGVSAHIMNPPPAVFASYLVRFRFDRAKVSDRFIGYVLKSPMWANYVQAAHTGSGQPQLNATLMKGFEFSLPPLDEQQRIAQVLGALDSKIEVNRCLAKTLEKIAATLFKARFVNFAEHDDLIESEPGPIPRGWSWEPLSSIAEILGGGTPKTDVAGYWDGDIPWISVKDTVPGPYVISVDRCITEDGRKAARLTTYPANTAVITARGTVGNVALMSESMTLNQSCYALRGNNGVGQFFLFHLLRRAVAVLQSRAHGSVFSTITRATFDSVMAAIPPQEEINQFEELAQPIFARIHAAMREANELAEVRDVLLPRLISGEIRVSSNMGSAQEEP